MHHKEMHRTARTGWLRASVLGANDGIISTSSLLLGMAAGQASPDTQLLAGIAGLVAGAMSMAAGEYVSVYSQADTEKADIELERHHLKVDAGEELEELAVIYVERGLDIKLAREVARQLMAHDALGAHARDELGIVPAQAARPVQAALSSAIAFTIGACVPLLVLILAPLYTSWLPDQIGQPLFLAATALLSLAFLGGLAARIGGASMWVGAGRVMFWGAAAMALTSAIGSWIGGAV